MKFIDQCVNHLIVFYVFTAHKNNRYFITLVLVFVQRLTLQSTRTQLRRAGYLIR